MMDAPTPKVFISYRRDDTAYQTTAIHDKLAAQLGDEYVFMDVDTIPAGRDFRKVIANEVQRCDVLVAVIGEKWLSASNEAGERRLDLPTDYVRLEIEAALQRDISVIPVLVGKVALPSADEVPSSLSDLVYRHGAVVRPGRDFQRDVETLIGDIIRTTGSTKTGVASEEAVTDEASAEQTLWKGSYSAKGMLGGALLLGLTWIALIGFVT